MAIFISACGERAASDNAADSAPSQIQSGQAPAPARAKMAAESDAIGGAEQSLTEISEPANNAAKNCNYSTQRQILGDLFLSFVKNAISC